MTDYTQIKTTMVQWQERLIAERNELEARLWRLRNMIEGAGDSLPRDTVELLLMQKHFMTGYLLTLNQRIAVSVTELPE